MSGGQTVPEVASSHQKCTITNNAVTLNNTLKQDTAKGIGSELTSESTNSANKHNNQRNQHINTSDIC